MTRFAIVFFSFIFLPTLYMAVFGKEEAVPPPAPAVAQAG